MKRLLPIIYDEGDFVSYGEVLRYIFVKANCIFVYGDETDQQPLYLIQLDTVKAIQENSKKPDKYSFTISPRINTNEAKENLVTILLKDVKTGKQVYQVAFDTTDDKSLAKRFLDVMRTNAKHYGGEVISASVVKQTTNTKNTPDPARITATLWEAILRIVFDNILNHFINDQNW